METQIVYVNPNDETAVLKCPNCGAAKIQYVGHLKGSKRTVKIRCGCETDFLISFEFRKAQRKETNIQGYFVKLPEGEEWQKMLVTNISLCGIGLLAQSTHDLAKGDVLRVRFSLKDKARQSIIERDAVVRWTDNIHVGCEFRASVEYDTVDVMPGYYLAREA
jgi:hypothetical protein